jgi:hypothetical protein
MVFPMTRHVGSVQPFISYFFTSQLIEAYRSIFSSPAVLIDLELAFFSRLMARFSPLLLAILALGPWRVKWCTRCGSLIYWILLFSFFRRHFFSLYIEIRESLMLWCLSNVPSFQNDRLIISNATISLYNHAWFFFLLTSYDDHHTVHWKRWTYHFKSVFQSSNRLSAA